MGAGPGVVSAGETGGETSTGASIGAVTSTGVSVSSAFSLITPPSRDLTPASFPLSPSNMGYPVGAGGAWPCWTAR